MCYASQLWSNGSFALGDLGDIDRAATRKLVSLREGIWKKFKLERGCQKGKQGSQRDIR